MDYAAIGVAVSSFSKVMLPGGERNVSLAAVCLPFIAIILLAVLSLLLSRALDEAAQDFRRLGARLGRPQRRVQVLDGGA